MEVKFQKEEARPPQNHGGDASSLFTVTKLFDFVNDYPKFRDNHQALNGL